MADQASLPVMTADYRNPLRSTCDPLRGSLEGGAPTAVAGLIGHLLARWGEGRPWLERSITLLFAIGLALSVALFANGYWVA